MTYQELLKKGTNQLIAAGIEEAQTDAWCLLEFAAGIDRTHYFLSQKEEVSAETYDRYTELISRRAERIPLQHLTGKQCFCGFDFTVNEHVLIPRQDTECLVEEVLKVITPGQRILDLCTGSGCMIISIAKLTSGKMSCDASDISEEALKVAKKNAEDLGAEIHFYRGDLFEQVSGTYDCIVSNPPYIETEEIGKLMPEVRDHEPFQALDGKEDGLYFYRRIIEEAAVFLNPKGRIFFEIGCGQGKAVEKLLKENGFTETAIKKDLAGLDRIVSGQRP